MSVGQSDSLPLHLYDAWSRWLLARAAPIRFEIAQTPAEREAIYRLRYQTAIARGWIKPEDFPDGLEYDAYDERAVHLAGWDGTVLAASARLVIPSLGVCLPIEDAFGLEIEPRGQVVEWSRLIVTRPYSDREHRIVLGLMGACWLEMRGRGFHSICSPLTAPVLKLFRVIGLRTTTLGPPRPYGGEARYPVRIDPPAAESRMIQLWRKTNLSQ